MKTREKVGTGRQVVGTGRTIRKRIEAEKKEKQLLENVWELFAVENCFYVTDLFTECWHWKAFESELKIALYYKGF